MIELKPGMWLIAKSPYKIERLEESNHKGPLIVSNICQFCLARGKDCGRLNVNFKSKDGSWDGWYLPSYIVDDSDWIVGSLNIKKEIVKIKLPG